MWCVCVVWCMSVVCGVCVVCFWLVWCVCGLTCRVVGYEPPVSGGTGAVHVLPEVELEHASG